MTLSAEPEVEKTGNLRTLIDDLLDEQQRLTPVERFSRIQDGGDVPAQARYYHDLIPHTKPGLGQQYAFAVDLDACTGCKACVSACHSLNGLEEDETWRSVGLLHGSTDTEPYRQTITTACHHCVEPGCLEGCPVMAYDKDAKTGIVRHLDDQCIGCQYCMLKCPYDVPQYSERLGIVRKCDMCIDRLGAGEAPACVQACPHEAISIELVERAEIVNHAVPGMALVPGAFDSSYTKPTTRFVSKHPLPTNAEPADEAALRLENPHWPLIWMLLLTQMGVGLFVALAIMPERYLLGLAGWSALHLGLAISILHLGRPLGAWRFFLGLRTSWMSREILAFGVFSILTTLTVGVMGLALFIESMRSLVTWTAGIAALVGLVGVLTSAMIYVDTRRPFWSMRLTIPKFFGTTFTLGITAAAAVLSYAGVENGARGAIIIATIARAILVIWDSTQDVPRATQTMLRLLPWTPEAAMILLALSMAAGVAAVFAPSPIATVEILVALASTFAGSLMERYCFFAACPAPRMPGGVVA
jgi:Fe-S-cluster-containing dehydrogenase component/DMSO reductase anchor subunit